MKKLFVIAVVFAMTLSTISSVAFTTTANAASAGDLITADYTDAVYYLGANGKRYVFTNQKSYMTWYEDFSGVVTVSQSELESYAIGGNVTYRPGTRMIKITTDPKVYAVEPGGVLRWVTTEDIATELYGTNWNTKIDDVSDAFWVNYTMGADITSATYPTGSLVKESGSATVYYIDADGNKRPVSDATAMAANRFRDKFIQTSSDLSGYSAGTSITDEESEIVTTAGPGSADGGDVSSTGTLSVAVSSNTPASATIVKNATFVKYTKVNFTATGGDVVIDSMKILRTGLSSDSNFSNVYLLDEDEEMVGNEKSLGSVHTAVVNDDITIANGTTKSYYVAATMHSTLQAGEVAGLAISEINVKGDAVVSGTLPLEGNSMTMNTTIAIGAITQDPGTTNPTAGSTSKQVGTTDYTFAAAKLIANSTEDISIERIRFYQSGTASDSDVANLELVVEGNVLATGQLVDKAVIFDLSNSPYTLTKGLNKDFEVRGDIVDGSSRTIEFEFNKKTDIKAKGKTYGFYITPSYEDSQTSSPYWNNTSYTTIATGTLNVSKKVMSATYVAEGSTQATLGSFTFRANGEPVIITQVIMELTTSTGGTGDVTNVTIYDENNNVVAGPVDPTTTAIPAPVTLTDTFTVPTGEHVYYVKGDLDTDWASGETIRIDFNTPATKITSKGETTNNSVTPAPTSEVRGDTMTVRVGALSVSTANTPVAQTVVAGTSGVTFANFILDASSGGEDVKVTQLTVRHTTTAADIHQDITNIKVYKGSTLLNANDIETGTSGTSTSKSTTTIDLDTALIIPKGSSVTLTLKGDISGSSSANDAHAFSMVGDSALVAYGVDTGNSITETISNSDGQTMTVTANAALTVSVSSASPTSDSLLPGNTDGMTVGVWNFRAQYCDINLEEIYIKVSAQNGGGPDQFAKFYLYDGATKVGEGTATTTDSLVGSNTQVHLNMSNDPVVIGAGTNKDLTVKVDTSNPDYYNYGGSTKGESGEGFSLTITAVGDIIARANGLLAAANKTISSAALKNYYLYKSVPTVLPNDMMSGGIVSGTLLAGTSSNKELYKFSVTADSAGDVGLYKVSFLVTTSVATATDWYLYQGGSQVANTTTVQYIGSGITIVELMFTNDGTAPDANHSDVLPQTISAGQTKTYTLKASVTGPSGTASGSIQIQFLGDGAFPATYPLGANALQVQRYENNFIWGDYYRTGNSASTTASSTEQWTNGYLVPTTATTKLQPTSTAVTFSK